MESDRNQLLRRSSMASCSDPPFEEAYKILFDKTQQKNQHDNDKDDEVVVVEECELPVIDLSRLLHSSEAEREECKSDITRASQEWGFFQVVNHGISSEILGKLRLEQEKIFNQPFEKKSKEDKLLNFSPGSYRWGAPSASCIEQISWSEAFHIPLSDILQESTGNNSLSSRIEQFVTKVSSLAHTLAEIVAEKMGYNSSFFQENCLPSTCYLRLNRYPPCPMPFEVHGLMPHTDSDFLTILHQDQVGGLQLVKDGKWIAVKPNPNALIINIGDLFQVWSNDVCKSVEHRVVVNPQVERFSTAYFFCPSHDTVIESCREPSAYKKFSFGEYREQVLNDVQELGTKIGLRRFLQSS